MISKADTIFLKKLVSNKGVCHAAHACTSKIGLSRGNRTGCIVDEYTPPPWCTVSSAYRASRKLLMEDGMTDE